jgi:ubiquinone/menaquinone biosynthesis C-methylase UbiE
LPFAEETFEALVAIAVIQHITSKYWELIFSEFCRILKKNGFLLMTTFDQRGDLDSQCRDSFGRLQELINLNELSALCSKSGMLLIESQLYTDRQARSDIKSRLSLFRKI